MYVVRSFLSDASTELRSDLRLFPTNCVFCAIFSPRL